MNIVIGYLNYYFFSRIYQHVIGSPVFSRLRSQICFIDVLHVKGRVRGDHWDRIISEDNLYLFFCPGWKICNKSLRTLKVFYHLMLLVIVE